MWLVFSELFEEEQCRRKGGYSCTHKILHVFFEGGFLLASFHSRFKVVFQLANLFHLANVSVQVVLFSHNLVLRTSLISLTWKVKEVFELYWFCCFSLCKAHLTYCFGDGCWFVQSFSRIFPIERLHPTDKIWLVLIIYLAIIINYYHPVLIHEKNWDHYLLAVSQWLWKYIWKSSIQSSGSLSLSQVICWNTVWLYRPS